ncbi:putative pre-mRNA 3 [Penaeus vannamei]|uniref:Putative pre-mRNA 3 n=1 Tax=Penaeus vannamei TaxID=6689 RepID=A0A423SWC1_PENVA|nr:putative pre-mRNA 3 [Penaeus vannamei]
MRIQESGAGLTGLGISVTKPFGNTPSSIPVAIVNDNSKYGGSGSQRPKAGPPPRNKGMGQIDVIGGASNPKTSTIQVMTADRREYSNKVMMNGPPPPLPPSQPGYNDMEFGGNPYGDTYYGNEGNNFYGGGSYDNPSGWGSGGQPPWATRATGKAKGRRRSTAKCAAGVRRTRGGETPIPKKPQITQPFPKSTQTLEQTPKIAFQITFP